jgi:hypothetical protein
VPDWFTDISAIRNIGRCRNRDYPDLIPSAKIFNSIAAEYPDGDQAQIIR